jgi:LPXTG-site transpeptidase (sortase) family protein
MSRRKNSRSPKKHLQLIPWILILSGVIIILFSTSVYFAYKQNSLKFNSLPVPEEQKSTNPPTEIEIPSRKINLSVEQAFVEQNHWQISEKGVSHLSLSASPGQGGNIVMYGHNKKNIFGPLVGLKKGTKIVLTTKDGQKHTYLVADTFEADPNQVEILNPTNSEVLTLYTCTGFADSKRFVVKAVPAV